MLWSSIFHKIPSNVSKDYPNVLQLQHTKNQMQKVSLEMLVVIVAQMLLEAINN